MIRKNAERLTKLCCERNWINDNQREWCIYAFEKWIGILLFFSAVVLWAVTSSLYVETLSFLLPFYLLRRRMGGCHASKPSTCFAVSIGLVIFVSAALGKWLMCLPAWLLLAMDAVIVLVALILKPAYPPQVNFTQDDKLANCRKKNVLLLIIITVQAASAILLGVQILAYSMCGIAFSVVTVIIQKNILLRGDLQHEKF